MKVAVLYGEPLPGSSADEQDALVQVDLVGQCLGRLGHQSVPVPLTLDMRDARSRLSAFRPQIVFNLLEAVEGRGEFIYLAPALLDHLNLSYTGAPTAAMFLTSNKLLAKDRLRRAGIATPPWACNAASVGEDLPGTGRCIVKSVWEHASIGIGPDSVAAEPAALRRIAGERRARYGGEWFAEAYVEGREFNVSLLAGPLGPQVLPCAEIRFLGYGPERLRIVDYRAKWDMHSHEFHHTPRTFAFRDADRPLLGQLADAALRVWDLFGLRGYARIDYRVDGQGKPWVLEVNANPCLSPDAGFLAAAAEASLSPDQVVQRIMDDAVLA